VVAALALSVPAASAHKVTYPSTLEILGFGSSVDGGATDYLWGRVSSSRPKCVAGRSMILKREISGQPFTVDTGASSSRGFFSLGGDDLELGGFVLLEAKRVAKKGHKHECGLATEEFNP
jgi:hypothetical protein